MRRALWCIVSSSALAFAPAAGGDVSFQCPAPDSIHQITIPDSFNCAYSAESDGIAFGGFNNCGLAGLPFVGAEVSETNGNWNLDCSYSGSGSNNTMSVGPDPVIATCEFAGVGGGQSCTGSLEQCAVTCAQLPASSAADRAAVAKVDPARADQVPDNCPHVCDQTYALCIAATCNPYTGECGRCEAGDGSCGYCYVFEGESCSYNLPCDQVAPSGDTVYSTYSEVLAAQYGFQVMTCPSPKQTADCMDGKCTLTGKAVTLTDKNGQKQEIPTAICQCVIASGGPNRTLGGQCSEQNCSAVWSTAGSVLDSQPACIEAADTPGH